MKAILTDGPEVDCAGFKALDEGVVLFADERRTAPVGFLPTHRLLYVLPDDVARGSTSSTTGEESATTDDLTGPTSDGGASGEDGPGETGDGDELGEVGDPEHLGETDDTDATGASDDAEPETDVADVGDSGGTTQLTARTLDGVEIPCGGFKSLGSGVLLFADADRTQVVGYVPHGQLDVVLDAAVLADAPGPHAGGDGTDRFVDAEDLVDRDAVRGAYADLVAGEREQTSPTRGVYEEIDVQEAAPDADVSTPGDESDATAGTEPVDVTPDDGPGPERGPDDTDAGAEEASGAESDADDVAVVDLEENEDLTRLAGLGETYADRLRDWGIETVSDLRAASVEELVEAADVSRGRAERWKDQVE
jgi:predicted flap endonuclease-1-like 5' DNA nuclease